MNKAIPISNVPAYVRRRSTQRFILLKISRPTSRQTDPAIQYSLTTCTWQKCIPARKNSSEKGRVVLAVGNKNVLRVYRLGKNNSTRFTRLIRFTGKSNKINKRCTFVLYVFHHLHCAASVRNPIVANCKKK